MAVWALASVVAAVGNLSPLDAGLDETGGVPRSLVLVCLCSRIFSLAPCAELAAGVVLEIEIVIVMAVKIGVEKASHCMV